MCIRVHDSVCLCVFFRSAQLVSVINDSVPGDTSAPGFTGCHLVVTSVVTAVLRSGGTGSAASRSTV